MFSVGLFGQELSYKRVLARALTQQHELVTFWLRSPFCVETARAATYARRSYRSGRTANAGMLDVDDDGYTDLSLILPTTLQESRTTTTPRPFEVAHGGCEELD